MPPQQTDTTLGSVFRDFLKSLRKHWVATLPIAQPAKAPLGPNLPKASTFCFGMVPNQSLYLFLQFQHSSKSWELGEFTINVVISSVEGQPKNGHPKQPATDWKQLDEGIHRIGHLLVHKDKWWHLRDNPGRQTKFRESWQASDYSDYGKVIADAVADVTRDVNELLSRLAFAASPAGA